MKRLLGILIIIGCAAWIPTQAQWTSMDTFSYQKANTDIDRPHGISFTGVDTGYTFERRTLRYTPDSAHSWYTITPALGTGSSIQAVSWPMAGKGFAVIHDSLAAIYRILKTTNNGVKWDTLPFSLTDSNHSVLDIHFTQPGLGMIAGDSTLYKTNDGGTTWQDIRISSFSYKYITRIIMPDTNRVWLIGFFVSGGSGKNRIVHSTDFGHTWDTTLASPSSSIIDLYPFTDNYLLTVNDSGTTFISTDKGSSWASSHDTLQVGTEYSFSVPDSSHCYLFSPYFIYVSHDKGHTFTTLASPPYKTAFKGVFTDSLTGYLIATAQTTPGHWDIYKTYNGGICATLIFPAALHVCKNVSFPLTYFTGVKNPAFKSFSWAPSATLDSAHTANPIASPTATTTYTLTINYSSMSNCAPGLVDSIKVYVAQCDSVWPGDANADLVVDENDLLNIGLAYNEHGTARAVADRGNAFRAVPAVDWAGSFGYGVNYKHGDCNGDSVINADDTLAIVNNFNKTHVSRLAPRESNAEWPTLRLSYNKDTALVKQHVQLTVSMYNGKRMVDSIYGMAFGLQLDPTLIDTALLNLDYTANFFTATGNALHVTKYFRDKGTLYTAITRINHANKNNDTGIICRADIVIIDNLAGTSKLPPHISGRGYFITSNGSIQPYNIVTDTLTIKSNVGTKDILTQPAAVQVYPTVSPGSYTLRYDAAFARRLNIRAVDLMGHTLFEHNTPDAHAWLTQTINLPAQAAPGMYWIVVTDNVKQYIIPVIKMTP